MIPLAKSPAFDLWGEQNPFEYAINLGSIPLGYLGDPQHDVVLQLERPRQEHTMIEGHGAAADRMAIVDCGLDRDGVVGDAVGDRPVGQRIARIRRGMGDAPRGHCERQAETEPT